jgi:hypothetical protein
MLSACTRSAILIKEYPMIASQDKILSFVKRAGVETPYEALFRFPMVDIDGVEMRGDGEREEGEEEARTLFTFFGPLLQVTYHRKPPFASDFYFLYCFSFSR